MNLLESPELDCAVPMKCLYWGPQESDCVTSEFWYKGQFYKGGIYFFVKLHSKKYGNHMSMSYPNLC